ncbi:MAG: hypothetical protein BGO50_16185 [Rhodanobacter sp. 67-28]|nr:MAG: hypothetical protein ABS82_08650 [Rhodanobacter sp. SCN 67-45]OJW36887.1 MAG: hypothetical protein BGO50_16185 [Rhodanobacter sp. 67-28]
MNDITEIKAYLRDKFVGKAVTPSDMTKSCKAVLGSLPIIANALAKASGKTVAVQHGHTLGATDGNTIYMMDMPIPKDSSDIDTFVLMLALSYGLIHHEIGHVNDSTFDDPEINDGRRSSALVDHLVGIIEDVRQENVHIARYPGSKLYLDGLAAALQVTGHYAPVTPQERPLAILTGYLLYRLYWEYRGDHTVENMLVQAEDAVRQTFPEGLVARLETVLPRMDDLESTADAMELARDIADLLMDEADKAQQEASTPPPGGQDAQQGQGTPSQGGQAGNPTPGDASQDGAAQSDSGQDDPSQQDESQGDPQGGASSGAGNGHGDASTKEKEQRATNLQAALDADKTEKGYGDRSRDIAAALNAIISQVEEEGPAAHVEMTGEHLDAEVAATSSDLPMVTPGYDMAEALSVTAQLRMRLVREMQSIADGEVTVGTRGRRLSGGHLARVGVADGRIFRTVDEEVEVNTAVCLLEDVSGSMDGEPIELASKALYATTRAMEGIDGVNVAAATFPGFYVVKPFGVKSGLVRDRFNLDSHGGTPMAQGITLARRMLTATPERRKMLIVITDGRPDSRPATEVAILAAQAAGIEIYGLGIKVNAGEGLFPTWLTIKSVAELPYTMIGLLRERLFAKAA